MYFAWTYLLLSPLKPENWEEQSPFKFSSNIFIFKKLFSKTMVRRFLRRFGVDKTVLVRRYRQLLCMLWMLFTIKRKRWFSWWQEYKLYFHSNRFFEKISFGQFHLTLSVIIYATIGILPWVLTEVKPLGV
jgi:hypothetical protein